MIHGNSQSNNDLATYRRVVIPIGRTPKRLDCSWLYELEVERLQTAAVEDGASSRRPDDGKRVGCGSRVRVIACLGQ
ncbi:hypothetical protein [Mesorhizobium sp.]|uniref:hypothetical protein n=1 Tax=Mesorhizobium sp. TaxID=1871066 RepID=UPI0034426CB0